MHERSDKIIPKRQKNPDFCIKIKFLTQSVIFQAGGLSCRIYDLMKEPIVFFYYQGNLPDWSLLSIVSGCKFKSDIFKSDDR